MAEIKWTAEAYRWLKDIYDYISLDNADAAHEVVFNIYKKVQLLNSFPQAGYKYRDEPEGEIRILLYGHYRIAYLLRGNNSIEILGIFHGSLDIDKYIF